MGAGVLGRLNVELGFGLALPARLHRLQLGVRGCDASDTEQSFQISLSLIVRRSQSSLVQRMPFGVGMENFRLFAGYPSDSSRETADL